MKWFKRVFYTLLIITVILVVAFFTFNDSYKYSLEAKLKYMMGNYKEAIELAHKAFELDPYNKMAFSMLAQSKISIKFLNYIEDGEKYLKKIELISKKSNITHEDKIKVKMMCEVMLERYKKLAPTVLTPKPLVEKSKKLYQTFKKIYENLDI